MMKQVSQVITTRFCERNCRITEELKLQGLPTGWKSECSDHSDSKCKLWKERESTMPTQSQNRALAERTRSLLYSIQVSGNQHKQVRQPNDHEGKVSTNNPLTGVTANMATFRSNIGKPQSLPGEVTTLPHCKKTTFQTPESNISTQSLTAEEALKESLRNRLSRVELVLSRLGRLELLKEHHEEGKASEQKCSSIDTNSENSEEEVAVPNSKEAIQRLADEVQWVDEQAIRGRVECEKRLKRRTDRLDTRVSDLEKQLVVQEMKTLKERMKSVETMLKHRSRQASIVERLAQDVGKVVTLMQQNSSSNTQSQTSKKSREEDFENLMEKMKQHVQKVVSNAVQQIDVPNTEDLYQKQREVLSSIEINRQIEAKQSQERLSNIASQLGRLELAIQQEHKESIQAVELMLASNHTKDHKPSNNRQFLTPNRTLDEVGGPVLHRGGDPSMQKVASNFHESLKRSGFRDTTPQREKTQENLQLNNDSRCSSVDGDVKYSRSDEAYKSATEQVAENLQSGTNITDVHRFRSTNEKLTTGLLQGEALRYQQQLNHRHPIPSHHTRQERQQQEHQGQQHSQLFHERNQHGAQRGIILGSASQHNTPDTANKHSKNSFRHQNENQSNTSAQLLYETKDVPRSRSKGGAVSLGKQYLASKQRQHTSDRDIAQELVKKYHPQFRHSNHL